MKRKTATLTALLLCLLLALAPIAGLGEEELSYELANGLPTGIEEDDELSYELANGLPTGIEEDDEPSYELANGLPTGIEEDDEPSYELAHGLPTGIETLYAYVKTANGKGLNLRAEASTHGIVISTIPYGARVTVTGYYSSSWAAVVYGNNNGYCMTRYLSDTPPGPVATYTPSYAPVSSATDLNALFSGFQPVSYSATVVPSTPTGYVNLRWAPSKSAPTRAVYRSGDIVSVIALGGGWAQLYDGATQTAGFMMSQFLTRIQEYGTAGSTMK